MKKEIILVRDRGCYECQFYFGILDDLTFDYPGLEVKTVDRTFGDDFTRVPTLLFMKEGFEISRLEGLVPLSFIKREAKNAFN